MADVNVTDLRQRLPSFLERARRGERIRVTSRGRVIAEISSPKAAEAESKFIRERLRGSLLHYELPTGAAHDSEEWSVNE